MSTLPEEVQGAAGAREKVQGGVNFTVSAFPSGRSDTKAREGVSQTWREGVEREEVARIACAKALR